MKQMKNLGLAVVAVVALTAVFGAASASAVPTFTASSGGLKLKNTTIAKFVFSVTGSPIECKLVGLEGATEGTDISEQSVHPFFGECTAFGFSATFEVVTCKIVFGAGGAVKFRKTHTKPEDAPCVMRVKVKNIFAECETVIGEQEIANGVSYSNGSGDVVFKWNGAANIADEVTKSSGLCPLTVGKHANMHFSGEWTFQAEGGTFGWDA